VRVLGCLPNLVGTECQNWRGVGTDVEWPMVSSTGMRASPFDWIDERLRPRVFWALTALVVGLSHGLGVLGMPLFSEAAPLGIVSFELAGNAEAAAEIMLSWSVEARDRALFIQGFDSLYLIAYPAWLGLGCTQVARRLGEGVGCFGLTLSWLVLLAGLFDVFENYALTKMLFDGASDGLARLAWACAYPKFGLVALAFLYMVAGGVWGALRNRGVRSEG